MHDIFFQIDSGAVLKILTNSKSLFDDEKKHASNWIFSSNVLDPPGNLIKIFTFFTQKLVLQGDPTHFFSFLGCVFNDDTRFEMVT